MKNTDFFADSDRVAAKVRDLAEFNFGKDLLKSLPQDDLQWIRESGGDIEFIHFTFCDRTRIVPLYPVDSPQFNEMSKLVQPFLGGQDVRDVLVAGVKSVVEREIQDAQGRDDYAERETLYQQNSNVVILIWDTENLLAATHGEAMDWATQYGQQTLRALENERAAVHQGPAETYLPSSGPEALSPGEAAAL